MNYWLMKCEPMAYNIDDLERDNKSMWEGCRNYQVRNRLRDEMQIGDLAFFYHSNANPSGIVGTMKIVSKSYPDPTQFDPNSKYFDPKSKPENPTWFVVNVEFQSKFKEIISLEILKNTLGLEQMQVTRKGQRLSVLPVAAKDWEIIVSLASF